MIILTAVLLIVTVIEVRLKSDKNEVSDKVLSGKTLVVYFSLQNYTKKISEQIAEKLDADIFEIVPKEILDENVVIAYPIWWKIAAHPVSSFVMGNIFDNKNIYPVCTSASSGLGDSAKNLKSISSGGTWHEGYRFSEDATSSDIDIWLKTISK